MADLTMVCCTHGRAGQVTSFQVYGDDLLLSVAESQVPAYRDAYPDARIDPHPDSVVGMGAKLNYLYKKFGDMFIIDDDEGPMVDQGDGSRVEPKKAVALAHRLADQTEQMGGYLFAFGEALQPKWYQPQRPFRVSGMVSGGMFGLLEGSELWWPEEPVEYGIFADLWISALNAYYHRFVLVDEQHAIPGVDTLDGVRPGGLSGVRTMATMNKCAMFLKESFGDAVELKDPGEAALYYWRFRQPW